MSRGKSELWVQNLHTFLDGLCAIKAFGLLKSLVGKHYNCMRTFLASYGGYLAR